MTVSEFFERAEGSISNNPKARLTQDIKNLITALAPDPEKMFFDVHSHCFIAEHLPRDFMAVINSSDFLFSRNLLAAASRFWGKLRQWIGGRYYEYYEFLGRKLQLERFTKGKVSDTVLSQQFNSYNNVFEKKIARQRPHIFIVELMVDLERGIGPAPKPFYAQWQELSDLRGLRQHSKAIIPFFAIDPRNPNAYTDFLAAFSGTSKRINQTGQAFLDTAFPFFGVCVHPSLGYLPSDPVLMNIFKVCAAKKIPVTTHCGNAFFRFSGDTLQGTASTSCQATQIADNFYFDASKYGKARQSAEIERFFNDPARWIPVAETFPDLKINLGGFGGHETWDRYRSGLLHTPVHTAIDMLTRYPNVYADLSGVYDSKSSLAAVAELLYGEQFSAAQRDSCRTKLLHSTGYHLTRYDKSLETKVFGFLKQFETDKAMLHQLSVHNPMRFLFE